MLETFLNFRIFDVKKCPITRLIIAVIVDIGLPFVMLVEKLKLNVEDSLIFLLLILIAEKVVVSYLGFLNNGLPIVQLNVSLAKRPVESSKNVFAFNWFAVPL